MDINLIPIIISVISLAISLIQFSTSIYNRRFSIKLSPICYEKSKTELYTKYYLNLLIENKSNLPISITNIKATLSNGDIINCSLTKHYLGETFMLYGEKEENKTVHYSSEFPINIQPYGAVMPYIVFKLPKNSDSIIFSDSSSTIKFKVFTNRGIKDNCLMKFDKVNFFDL